jgi:hypothetical protein
MSARTSLICKIDIDRARERGRGEIGNDLASVFGLSLLKVNLLSDAF